MPDRHPTLFASRTRPGMRLPAADPAPDRPARWRIVEQTGDGPAELWLYDAIGEDFFGFGINAEQMCRDIAVLAADEILLRVNSPGGDYFDGIAIYNALVQHPAHLVAQVDGLAASAASFVIQAADEVVVGLGARVMIHDALGFCVGNAADMQAMTEMLDGISADIADLYHAHAGGGAKAWRERMRAETWFSADESVAAGLADRVMPAPKKRGQEQAAAAAVDWQVAASWDLSSVFRYPDSEAASAPAASAPEPVRQRIVASAVTSTVQGTAICIGEAGPELAQVPAGAVVAAAATTDPPEVPVGEAEPDPVPAEPAPDPVPDAVPAASPAVAADAPGSPGVPDLPGGPGTATPPEPEPTAASAVEPDPPAAAEPETPAPEPAAVPEPVPVAATAGAFPGPPLGPEPAQPDPWVALTQHLTDPRPATVDQLLAALRGTP